MNRKEMTFENTGELIKFILKDIEYLNSKETKIIERKFIKFNEEFGEFSAEVVKMLGDSYKPYDKEHLVEEMADALQCLLSIYVDITKQTEISIVDGVLPSILVKNEKWSQKIEHYTNNKPVTPSSQIIKEGEEPKLRLPADVVILFDELIEKYPETISWGGKKSTINFVCQGSTENDVVVFQKWLKGPSEYFVWTIKGFKHGGYTGHKDKYNIKEFEEYIINMDKYNKE